MRSSGLAIALVVLGIVFIILAVGYALGMIQVFTTEGTGPHYKHAILLIVLAVASFVGANFARPKTV